MTAGSIPIIMFGIGGTGGNENPGGMPNPLDIIGLNICGEGIMFDMFPMFIDIIGLKAGEPMWKDGMPVGVVEGIPIDMACICCICICCHAFHWCVGLWLLAEIRSCVSSSESTGGGPLTTLPSCRGTSANVLSRYQITNLDGILSLTPPAFVSQSLFVIEARSSVMAHGPLTHAIT